MNKISKKKNIIVLIIVSVLTVLIILLLSNSTKLVATDGVLDAREWNFEQQGTFILDGDWEFYNNEFLTPNEISKIEADSYESNIGDFTKVIINGNNIEESGYGTYHIMISRPNQVENLGLKLGDICADYTMYINGEIVAKSGNIALSLEETVGEYKPQSVFFTANGDIDIVIMVSTFRQPLGQDWSQIEVGTQSQIKVLRDKTYLFEGLMIGSSFIAFLIFFSANFIGKKNLSKSPLMLGLFSLNILLRVSSMGERSIGILFPNISFNVLFSIEYLTYYLGIALLVFLIDSYFQDLILINIKRIVFIVCAFSSLLVLIFPPRIFVYTLIPMQGFSIIVTVYLFVRCLKSTIFDNDGLTTITSGIIIFVICALNDILYTNGVINTGFFVSYSNFVLIYIYSNVMIQIYVEKYARNITLSKQVLNLNNTLEKKVEDRTKKLKEMALKDSLTNLYNHGFMFDLMERFADSDQEIKFSVLMFDIDYFKNVNDDYGHQSGDDVLVKLANYYITHKRPTDYVGRYGGEEFIMVLPETSLINAKIVAEKHRLAIKELCFNNSNIKITVSVGIAYYEGGSIPKLIELADKRLYKAKKAGRNCCV
jgi:diguanylate cyclase (GGDEF)-like protein